MNYKDFLVGQLPFFDSACCCVYSSPGNRSGDQQKIGLRVYNRPVSGNTDCPGPNVSRALGPRSLVGMISARRLIRMSERRSDLLL